MAYTVAEFPGPYGGTRYRVERDGRTIPGAGDTHRRDVADEQRYLLEGCPDGYRVERVQRAGEWVWQISRGTWRIWGARPQSLIADAAQHAETAAQRPAPVQPAAPAVEKDEPAAPQVLRCAGCGTELHPRQAMVANLGLSCVDCYDYLSN